MGVDSPVRQQGRARNTVKKTTVSKRGSAVICPHCKKVIGSDDEEFIVALRKNPAYHSLNIDVELGKMDAWLLLRPRRKKTKRFIVEWLNRAATDNREVETVNTDHAKALAAYDKMQELIRQGAVQLPYNVSKRGREAVQKCGGLLKIGRRREGEQDIVKKQFIKHYLEYDKT